MAVDSLAQAPYSGGRVGEVMLMSKVYTELARARFERCLRLDPKYNGGYRGLAFYNIITQNYDAALTKLATAEKYARRPEDKVAIGRMRVQAYLGQKKYNEAKAALDGLLAKFGDRGDVYYSLAEYYLRKEKPDVGEAKRALEVGPKGLTTPGRATSFSFCWRDCGWTPRTMTARWRRPPTA